MTFVHNFLLFLFSFCVSNIHQVFARFASHFRPLRHMQKEPNGLMVMRSRQKYQMWRKRGEKKLYRLRYTYRMAKKVEQIRRNCLTRGKEELYAIAAVVSENIYICKMRSDRMRNHMKIKSEFFYFDAIKHRKTKMKSNRKKGRRTNEDEWGGIKRWISRLEIVTLQGCARCVSFSIFLLFFF